MDESDIREIMNGMNLFIAGAIAISNLGLLAYLLTERNKSFAQDKPDKPEEEAAPNEPAVQKEDADGMVGKSKFSMDDLQEYVENLVDVRVQQLIDEKKIGLVKLGDVEFANKADEPSADEIQADEEQVKKDARMTKEQEEASFNDIRIQDVETDEISAPSATGTSMDELEQAFDDAVNPNASLQAKRRAGLIFCPLMNTVFMSNPEMEEVIKKGVDNCIKLSMRQDLNLTPKVKKVEPKPVVNKPPVQKNTEFTVATNIDDFNPADLLK